jgi:hypothetical protein
MNLYVRFTTGKYLNLALDIKDKYPELGANPSWDHEIDRIHGSLSRAKQVGTKHGSNRSVRVEIHISDKKSVKHLYSQN